MVPCGMLSFSILPSSLKDDTYFMLSGLKCLFLIFFNQLFSFSSNNFVKNKNLLAGILTKAKRASFLGFPSADTHGSFRVTQKGSSQGVSKIPTCPHSL